MPVPIGRIGRSNKPIAVMILPSKNVDFIKINVIRGRFFVCKYGLFQLDSNYAYKYKRTLIYFYDSTSAKPIDLTAVKKLQLVFEVEQVRTFRELIGEEVLEQIQTQQKTFAEIKAKSPHPEMLPNLVFNVNVSHIIEKKELPDDLKQFIIAFHTIDKEALKVLIVEIHHRKKPYEPFSPSISSIGSLKVKSVGFVELANRHIDIVQMPYAQKYAVTRHGTLMQNPQLAHNSKKQQVYFYPYEKNIKAHDKEKRRELVKKVKKAVKLMGDPMPYLEEYGIREPMLINTHFMLSDIRAFDPSAMLVTGIQVKRSQRAIESLGKRQKKGLPIMLLIIALMGFIVLISNARGIIDAVGDQIERFTGLPPAPQPQQQQQTQPQQEQPRFEVPRSEPPQPPSEPPQVIMPPVKP